LRHRFIPQMSIGAVDIADIEFNIASRHELVPILMALKYLYVEARHQLDQILELIKSDILQGQRHNRGCTGLSFWEILVLASIRLGCDLDFDQLADLASDHRKVQEMLGLAYWERKYYGRSTVHDNLSQLSATTIKAISDIIVSLGHQLVDDPVKQVRGDSYVLKKNIHYPTDSNLLYDGARKCLEGAVKIANEHDISGWRQHDSLLRKIRIVKNKIIKVARSRGANKENKLKKLYSEIIARSQLIVDKSLATIHAFEQKLVSENQRMSTYWSNRISELQYFIAGTEYVAELARRRVLNGESIANPEKVFSLFEPDTELINRGKRPYPIEFGHRVLIIQDRAGFIIDSHVLDIGFTDEKIIVEVMRKLQRRFNGRIQASSFDKGFWTPNNLKELSEFIPLTVLPKKGKRSEADRRREESKEFIKVRKWHAGIESAIHALGAGNGLTRCRDKGHDGYSRYFAMGILGRNLHTLGNLLLEKERQKRKSDALLALCMQQ
jgi:IS5 family transposase